MLKRTTLVAAAAAVALSLASPAPARALTAQQQQEQQIGAQVYQQLLQKGEIVNRSPYYAILDPIAHRIASVADRKYFWPFHFILVNQSSPNAFAVPGGNVYVTTSMMHFVTTKEELAGVLCHETSHDVHHDVLNLYVKDQRIGLYAGIASLLLGRNSGLVDSGINLLANLQTLRFSREVEENADHLGAITCAQAGITPWGLVWLMRAFENANLSNPPEFLSDHPSDQHRIAALESEIASDPSLFGSYNANQACGTPIDYRGGFYDQHRGACRTTRRQTPARTPRSPACPPGWKFCGSNPAEHPRMRESSLRTVI